MITKLGAEPGRTEALMIMGVWLEGQDRHDHEAGPGSDATTGAKLANTIYRGCMGMLIFIVLAAIALFFILSAVISALHFLFWVAVVALLVFAGLRLAGGMRRRSRR